MDAGNAGNDAVDARDATAAAVDAGNARAATVDAAVAALVAARSSGRPAAASGMPLPDAEAAYAVQHRVARALGWFGEADASFPRYWKSGAGSPDAVRTHAPLPAAGVWASAADASGWPFRLRGIEAELALRLACDVTPERAAALDVAKASALVDAVCAAIEVVDSRWSEGLDAPPLAKLADLQSHGALVLGAWTRWRPAHDASTQSCRVRIGAKPPAVWRGTHPLGGPAQVLPDWLRHATRDGRSVPAGTVVTTGTWCGLLDAAAGDGVDVEFAGVGVVSVRL